MNHSVNYGKMLLNTNDLFMIMRTGKVKKEVRFFKEDRIQRTHKNLI